MYPQGEKMGFESSRRVKSLVLGIWFFSWNFDSTTKGARTVMVDLRFA
jgi:hypothetical protein